MSNNTNKNLLTFGKTQEENNLLGLNQPQQQAKVNTNLRGIFQSIGPFTAGIFLDNDGGHRKSVEDACLGKITVPIVKDTYNFKKVPLNDTDYVKMLHQLSPKGIESAKLMFYLRNVYSKGREAYDVNSGIQDDTVEEIVEWVEENEKDKSKNISGAGAGTSAALAKPHLVAIFDFDRTISMMEGGFFMGNSVQEIKKNIYELILPEEIQEQVPGIVDKIKSLVPGLTVEGFAEYLAGGETRVTMLQEMFDYLYEHNVKIILLTNNTACSDVRGFFQEMMMVYTKGRPIDIICGMEFEYDKGRAIFGTNTTTGNLKSLSEMCMKSKKSGGKRTKKMRKQIRKRKQTKKH